MSRVTAKYQITIPVEVRKELGIVPGSEVDIKKKKDKYVLIVNPIVELKKRWRGKFRDEKTTDKYMDEVRGKIN
ncbi:MAG: AbrB/MazE/SpoVT family DNA-binding domain-containing protein [Nitrospirae bacterium]|nr:AbrB/MazE/SpoVT family DNA-binding domain-containing protein [Nitrospirota bacterium]